jgi:hypothetical protein
MGICTNILIPQGEQSELVLDTFFIGWKRERNALRMMLIPLYLCSL